VENFHSGSPIGTRKKSFSRCLNGIGKKGKGHDAKLQGLNSSPTIGMKYGKLRCPCGQIPGLERDYAPPEKARMTTGQRGGAKNEAK